MRRLPPERVENARTRMMAQLTQHLVDVTDLHRQVEQARGACGQHPDGAELFDELAETLAEHRTLIAERVRELSAQTVFPSKRTKASAASCEVGQV